MTRSVWRASFAAVRSRSALDNAIVASQSSAFPLACHWTVIHVAGTNGKGSVCAMIDSICRAAGYRAGLFTSPHLVTFRERIRVNGKMISEDSVALGLTKFANHSRLGSASDIF